MASYSPTASATTLQSYPLLPPQFNPPFPVTNRALLGYAFDDLGVGLRARGHVGKVS